MTNTTGRLYALAAALLFSTGGAGLKTDAFSVSQISALRSGIAAVALLIWLGGRVRVSPLTVGAATLYAGTVTLFVAATKLTTAAHAIFLQSAAPLYLVLLGPVVLGERVRGRDMAYLALVGIGLWFCFLGRPAATGTAPDPETGNLLGIVCSLTWAFTLIALRYIEREPAQRGGGLDVVVAGNAIASLVALPFAWPLPVASPVEWATVTYLGVCQIGVAYWCLTTAVRQLPALEVSLLLLVEPVLNPLWTWLLRGEEPGRAVLAGGGVIVAATAARALLSERAARQARSPAS
jgi:DME family drug/metabolite transporter